MIWNFCSLSHSCPAPLNPQSPFTYSESISPIVEYFSLIAYHLLTILISSAHTHSSSTRHFNIIYSVLTITYHLLTISISSAYFHSSSAHHHRFSAHHFDITYSHLLIICSTSHIICSPSLIICSPSLIICSTSAIICSPFRYHLLLQL